MAYTVKISACNTGESGSIPGSGRSLGEGNGNPLQYSCLENSKDRGAWQATVHGVKKIEHDSATNPHLHTPLVVSSPLGISQHNYIQFTQKDCLQIFQHRSGLLKSS